MPSMNRRSQIPGNSHKLPDDFDLRNIIRPHHNVVHLFLAHTTEVIFAILVPVLLGVVTYIYSIDRALWQERLEQGKIQADDLISQVNISELAEQLNQRLEVGWDSLNENVRVLQDVLQNMTVNPPAVPAMHLAWWQVLFTTWIAITLYWLHQMFVIAPKRYAEKPDLWCQPSKRNNRIKKRLLAEGQGSARLYVPTLWASNSHVQSFMFPSWPASIDVNFFATTSAMSNLKYQRKWVEVPEVHGGGAVSMEWVTMKDQESSSIADTAPVLLLLPGVIGSTQDLYLRRVALLALRKGWRVAGKNWRGLSVELVGDRPETWDHQSVIDMEYCIRQIKSEYPRSSSVFAFGFSTGGIVITTYMGMHSAQVAGTFKTFPMRDPALITHPLTLTGLDGGVNLSGLTDSERCAFQLETIGWPPYSYGLSKLVSLSMASKLPQLQKARNIQFLNRTSGSGELLSLPGDSQLGDSIIGSDDAQVPIVSDSLTMLRNIRRTIDYHNAITRHFVRADPPIETVTDYYHHIGVVHGTFQSEISSPLLCILADDDPLCSPLTMANVLSNVKAASGVFLLRTKKGGHCGFFSDSDCRPWADEVGIRFLEACLVEHQPPQDGTKQHGR